MNWLDMTLEFGPFPSRIPTVVSVPQKVSSNSFVCFGDYKGLAIRQGLRFIMLLVHIAGRIAKLMCA